jgi:glycosyltransferase involved in cell wall biosynthesis
MNETLLTVIIPTKNRQRTALFAIESVLRIKSKRLELVVQDCSDIDTLKDKLRIKYSHDKRLKYFYTNKKLSMNQNWSEALDHAKGKYVYGIGDDDGVLPSIIQVAEWMELNHAECAIPLKIQYIWENAFIGSFANGRLLMPSNYSGAIYEVDFVKQHELTIRSSGFGYTHNLPNIYHGFVLRKLILEHKNKVGCYFNGTSLDVYSAIILPAYINKLHYIDFPVSIWGACDESNSNRTNLKKSIEHLHEFKNYKKNQLLPNTFNAEVSVVETTFQALKDIKKEYLISEIRLALIYAKCASIEPMKFLSFFKAYLINKRANERISDYIKLFAIFLYVEFKRAVKESLAKIALKISSKNMYLIESFTSSKKPKCSDIQACIEYILKHQISNGISLNLSSENIDTIKPKKEIWH